MILGSFKDSYMATSVVERDYLFEAISSCLGISEARPLRFKMAGMSVTVTQARITHADPVDPTKTVESLRTLASEVWDEMQDEVQEQIQ